MTLQEMLDLTGQRKPSFEIMIEHLKTKEDPFIVETGCARMENNFDGDGMSTLIFDKYINDHNGIFCSVDITPANVEFARSKISNKTNLVCGDSVSFLWQLSKQLEEADTYIDLLYLDSFDFELHNPHPSSLHHLKELTAIISRLKSGTMISVDDNHFVPGGRIGKGEYVDKFFTDIGVKKIYNGYQYIWLIE
jgi:hypothetical protein